MPSNFLVLGLSLLLGGIFLQCFEPVMVYPQYAPVTYIHLPSSIPT
jgi:hypothetical protein